MLAGVHSNVGCVDLDFQLSSHQALGDDKKKVQLKLSEDKALFAAWKSFSSLDDKSFAQQQFFRSWLLAYLLTHLPTCSPTYFN